MDIIMEKGKMTMQSIEKFIVQKLVQKEHSEVEKAKLAYGIKILLSDIYKMVAVYFVAIALNCWLEVFIMHLAFFTIRQVSLGYHFSNNLLCVFWSIILFPVLCKLFIMFDLGDTNFLLIICVMFICFVAPVGTKKNKVINANHRKYLKKHVFIRLIVILLTYVIVPHSIKMLITLGVFVQCIMLFVQLILNKKEGLQ